jgi:hypothetical protein
MSEPPRDTLESAPLIAKAFANPGSEPQKFPDGPKAKVAKSSIELVKGSKFRRSLLFPSTG